MRRTSAIRRKSSRAGRDLPSVGWGARGRLRGKMIGSSPRRKEDQRLLTGHGRFVDDLAREGTLHLGVVRSTEAHARLAKVATAPARVLPGVVLAWNASDL